MILSSLSIRSSEVFISFEYSFSSFSVLVAAVFEYYAGKGGNTDVTVLGIKDEFIPHGSVSEQLAFCGLDEAGIYAALAEKLFNS